jgi:hypothetical protein
VKSPAASGFANDTPNELQTSYEPLSRLVNGDARSASINAAPRNELKAIRFKFYASAKEAIRDALEALHGSDIWTRDGDNDRGLDG